jgi:hypothetical protein
MGCGYGRFKELAATGPIGRVAMDRAPAPQPPKDPASREFGWWKRCVFGAEGI